MIIQKMKKNVLIAEEIKSKLITLEFVNQFVKKDCRFILIDEFTNFSIVISGYKKNGIIKIFYDKIVENVSIENIFEEIYNVKLEKNYYTDFTDEIFDSVIMYDDNELTGEFFEIIKS